MEVSEGKVSDEHGGFQEGEGAIQAVVEEHLGKDEKLQAAFKDLDKAFDRVDGVTGVF